MDEIPSPGPRWRRSVLSSASGAASQSSTVASLRSNSQFLADVLSLGPELTMYPILVFYPDIYERYWLSLRSAWQPKLAIRVVDEGFLCCQGPPAILSGRIGTIGGQFPFPTGKMHCSKASVPEVVSVLAQAQSSSRD